MPIIGQYTISDVAKISSLLHDRYGRIVRFGGLIGRPDLLFIYDADEIEKVSFKTRQRLGTFRMTNEPRRHQAITQIYGTVQIAHSCRILSYSNFMNFQCYRSEGPTPFRPSMPSLVKYKSVVRKDFFGDLGGVVGV